MDPIAVEAFMRLTSEASFGLAMTYQYDKANNRIRSTWPDNIDIHYDFDALNRLWRIREQDATSGVGVLATYTLDSLSRTRAVSRGNGTASALVYDSASRLTSLTHDLLGSAQDVTWTLGYTPASQINMRTNSNVAYENWGVQSMSRAYVPDGNNRYASVARLPTVMMGVEI